MHPILFKIPIFGGITVYTYGFMVALAFLAGIIWVYFEAKRVGESHHRATDLVFWVIISAIIGARIFYIFVAEPQRFLKDPLTFFKVWEGGLVFYGGLIGALIASFLYIKRNRLKFWVYADIFAPAIPLGHVFGRIGCFMAGCCYGRPAPDAWWSVVFPKNPATFAPADIPLYPTQLMEAAGEFIIFLFLFFMRRWKRFHGELLALYLFLYAILRGVVEFYRGDPNRGYLFGETVSTAQFVSILMLVFAVITFFINRKKFPVGM